MAKCFIIFGRINKLIILPLLLTITQIVYIVVNKYLLIREQKYSILELLMISLGQMSIRLIPCIIKISNEKNKEKSKLTKKKKLLKLLL